METRLIIARHGNTFNQGEVVLRVGAKTDLPLATSGIQQAKNLSFFLQEKQLIPDLVFCSNLQRTMQTADYIIKTLGLNLTAQQNSIFNEIDYGIDDGKPEDEVKQRLGERALLDWDEKFVVPAGWKVNCLQLQQNWQEFAKFILHNYPGATVLVVTSGGIAKFASYLCKSIEHFKQQYTFKLATGSASLLINNHKDDFWQVKFWNKKPDA